MDVKIVVIPMVMTLDVLTFPKQNSQHHKEGFQGIYNDLCPYEILS